MLEATGNHTYQIHINVPGGDEEKGYADHHRLFGDEELSQQVMKLTKWVYKETQSNLLVVTLEMKTTFPLSNTPGKWLTREKNLSVILKAPGNN